MAKSILKASDEVIGVLRKAVFDESGITLVGQLDRKDYVAVNKFLEVAGAIWNKKAKRHLFQPGAKEKITALLETGTVRDDKKHFQAFYTPPELATDLVRQAWIEPHHTVLEPSAGGGRLLDAIFALGDHRRPLPQNIQAVEIDPKACQKLSCFPVRVHVGDFLEWNKKGKETFDRIVMNPPFTGAQDIKHIRHAVAMLKPRGILVAICAAGDRQKTAFEGAESWTDLPTSSFSESGTQVATAIVVFHGG